MKRTDELLLVYPGQSRSVRKWILSQLDTLGGAFDAPELFAFLLSQTQDDESVVRNQALFSLQMFLPPFVRARQASPSLVPPANPDGLRRAALDAAKPLVRALSGVAGRGVRAVRTLARLTLGQFPLPEVQQQFLAEYARTPGEFELLLGYARATAAGEMERPLVEIMKQYHREEPDLLLLVAGAAGDAATAAATALAGATNSLGRMNLAIALSKVQGGDRRSAAQALLALGEGWVAVHVLAALEVARDRAAVPFAANLLRHPTELVRLEAIRVAGALGGPDAVAVCLEAAKGGSPRQMAQALDSLVQLGAEPQVAEELAGRLLESPSPTARLSAVLAIADPADPRVARVMTQMVLSPEPHERLLAAFALGYRQGPGFLQYLSALATRDPCVPVRGQATKSLAKYPVAMALQPLLGLLGDPDPRIASAAGLALTRYTGAEAQELGTGALAALTGTKPPGVRARLYRLQGHLAAKQNDADAEACLIAGLSEPEPEVVCGALDGIKQLGRARDVDGLQDKLRALIVHENPAIAARAATASVLLGHVEAISTLASGLSQAEPIAHATWLQQALDLGLSMTEALPAGSYPELAKELGPGNATGPSGRAGLVSLPAIPVEASHVIRAITVEPTASVAEKLDGHLEMLKAQASQESSLHRAIRQDTAHLREAPSGVVNMPPGARELAKEAAARKASGPTPPASKPRASIPPVVFKAIGGLVLTAALVAGLVLLRGRRDPDYSGLSVFELAAAPTSGPDPGTPLKVGPLRPGTRIATGKAGRVRLKSVHGTIVELFPNAVAEIGFPASDGDVSITLRAGYLEAELKGDQLLVPFNGNTVECLRGKARVTIDGEKIRALNLEGETQVRLRNDEVLSLKKGEGVGVK